MADTFTQLGRIEATRKLFEGSPYAPFEEPFSFRPKSSESVRLSSVLLSEGIDFNLVYFPLKHLGYKSVVAVTGELISKLSKPQALSVKLGVSAKLDYEHISKLWSGVIVAAREFGYKQLGLELLPSKNGLSISLSALGVTSEGFQSMPKAQTKDLVCVSGSLGAAYLGMQVLEKKSNELDKYKMLVSAYLRPEIGLQSLSMFSDAGVIPSAGLFVSKGLSDAVQRLSRETFLGVKIYADKIPFEGNSFALGKELDIDPISAAMNGGDDYKLLFTIPIEKYDKFRADFQTFDIIGHLALPDVGTVLVAPDGLEHAITSIGGAR